MADQQFHFRIERQDLAQLGNRLGRAAAEIPGPVHGLIEQVVRAIRPPIQFARGEVDGRARQRRRQGIAGGIAELGIARIRIGIEAGDRRVVAPRHAAVAAVELAAKFADIETSRQPAADGLIDAGQRGHLVGKPCRRLLVGLPLDEIGDELALRVALDVGEIGACHRPLGFARHRRHARQRVHVLQEARAGEVAEIEQGRDHDQPAHADALLGLQIAHDLRSADAAIAFAGDKFRRQQAIVFFQPAPDHQRNRVDVAVDRIEPLARVLASRHETAVAGADGIDEYEIGEIKPGLGVGQQIGRR